MAWDFEERKGHRRAASVGMPLCRVATLSAIASAVGGVLGTTATAGAGTTAGLTASEAAALAAAALTAPVGGSVTVGAGGAITTATTAAALTGANVAAGAVGAGGIGAASSGLGLTAGNLLTAASLVAGVGGQLYSSELEAAGLKLEAQQAREKAKTETFTSQERVRRVLNEDISSAAARGALGGSAAALARANLATQSVDAGTIAGNARLDQGQIALARRTARTAAAARVARSLY